MVPPLSKIPGSVTDNNEYFESVTLVKKIAYVKHLQLQYTCNFYSKELNNTTTPTYNINIKKTLIILIFPQDYSLSLYKSTFHCY